MISDFFGGAGDILILVIVLVGIIAGVLYYLNRWASRKMTDQNQMIERTRQTVTIYVIDKKKAKVKEANLPKVVMEQMPKMYRFIKVPLVKAKVGAQITTLMCDKRVFNALPVKKNVKVDVAGIYITDMKGLKSEKEYKASVKAKKQKPDQPKDKH